ncbi:MAG: ribonuclease P protein component [Candidatus Levybacteria bacterium RBG_16_35_6]|nr:MAG: ribonuclease P protein component [Candidatus Levybacteria bacterium RBG_16_35_6]
MLAKKNRLPAKTSTKNFSTISFPFFVLKIGENSLNEIRARFIVSKEVDKRATARNRLKRQFRRFIEENYSKIRLGQDFLFRIRKEANGKKTEEIHKRIGEVFKKEKLFK